MSIPKEECTEYENNEKQCETLGAFQIVRWIDVPPPIGGRSTLPHLLLFMSILYSCDKERRGAKKNLLLTSISFLFISEIKCKINRGQDWYVRQRGKDLKDSEN